MKTIDVRLTVPRSGPEGSYSVGDKVKVSAAEAKRMLASGQIEPLKGAAEKAVQEVELPEDAAVRAAAEAADRERAVALAAAEELLGKTASAIAQEMTDATLEDRVAELVEARLQEIQTAAANDGASAAPNAQKD